jgi:hypothetical protein
MATQAQLYADSARGVYIPQYFAESYAPKQWRYINADDLEILMTGPEHESYFDAWDSVLNNAETVDGGKLHQDGDLWVYWPDETIETLQACIDWQVKYNESHVNAGDAYSHMPRESWCSDDDSRLADFVDRHDIGGEVDIDEIAEIALENFTMKPGTIYGFDGDENYFILASYPIDEHEIQIEHDAIGIDGVTWELIEDSRDFCIKGGCAYVGTDSVWFAAISRKKTCAPHCGT